VGAVVAGDLGSTRLRLLIIAAVLTPVDLLDSQEYYLFKVNIDRSHSTGPDACAGCSTIGCIVLNQVRLTRSGGSGDVFIEAPATNYYATWQGVNQAPPCPFVVPTQTSTWGQVKSLYR
jgi:hypothetical protein